jgi:uncharacterized OsmC-like protein
MAVEIRVAYEGALRTRATHGPSGVQLITDAPLDNQGRGESFSPTDLVATALGACLLTIMGIAAERRGVDLLGAIARVEKHMVADPERRIGALPVTITIPASPADAERQLLEKAARSCPVLRSLDPRIEKNIQFQWGAGPR